MRALEPRLGYGYPPARLGSAPADFSLCCHSPSHQNKEQGNSSAPTFGSWRARSPPTPADPPRRLCACSCVHTQTRTRTCTHDLHTHAFTLTHTTYILPPHTHTQTHIHPLTPHMDDIRHTHRQHTHSHTYHMHIYTCMCS